MRILAAAVLVSLIAMRPAAAAEPEEFVALDYEIRLNKILIATLAIDAEVGPRTYRLDSRTETNGLMDLILGFRSRAHAHGEVMDGKVIPELHSDDNVWLEEPRRVRIDYGPDGPDKIDVSPLPADEGRDEVPAEKRLKTLDLMSAVFQTSLWAAEEKVCQSRARVFDGRRRYDIAFFMGEVADMAIGSQIICGAELIRIAGRTSVPWLPRGSAPRKLQYWLTRISPDLPPVPSRMRAFGGIGWLVVQLTAHSRQRRPGGLNVEAD